MKVMAMSKNRKKYCDYFFFLKVVVPIFSKLVNDDD